MQEEYYLRKKKSELTKKQVLRKNRIQTLGDLKIPVGHICSVINENMPMSSDRPFSPQEFLTRLRKYLSRYGLTIYAPETLHEAMPFWVVESHFPHFLREYFPGIQEETSNDELWLIMRAAGDGYLGTD
jgi:hypothetical protein